MRRHITLLAALALATVPAHAATYGKQVGSGASSGVASVQPGTGISVDSTTPSAPIVTNASPASSDMVFQKPNSASAPFTIGELKTDWVSSTAGAETSYYNVIVPILGVPIAFPIASMNVAGKQSVTTVTATPTVAMNARADVLSITLGVDVTKLVVTGLDLATDGGYDFDGTILADGVHDVNCKLNDADATGVIVGLYIGSPSAFAPNTLQLRDSVAQNGQFIARLRDSIPGTGKAWQGNFLSNVPQWYFGHSTLTANITSFSLPNMLAGSVINVRRIRPTVQ